MVGATFLVVAAVAKGLRHAGEELLGPATVFAFAPELLEVVM